MKKKLLKILGTILAVVAFFIAQYHIRKYYGIDPRIWFFVVFGISFVGVVAILIAFHSEIKSMQKYFESYSFAECISKIPRKVKSITAKIVNSFTYDLLGFFISMSALTGLIYELFFKDEFITRTTLYIVFLVMVVLTALINIIKAIIIEGKERKKEFINGGMWACIFLIHFLEFVCT